MEVNVVWRRAAVSDEGKPAPITRCLAVARPFHLLDSHILVGTDDGIVSFLPLFSAAQPDSELKLDCNGNAITAIQLCTITECHQKDVIVGDSLGNVLTFASGLRVCVQSIGHPVSALHFSRDLYNNPTIFAGDSSGYITGLRPLMQKEKDWKLSLGPVSNAVGDTDQDWTVQQLQTVKLVDLVGLTSLYTLATTANSNTLHFLSGNSKEFAIDFPSPITSFCTGHFEHSSAAGDLQIAVACDNGEVFLVTKFERRLWFKEDRILTSLAALNTDLVVKGAEAPMTRHVLVAAGQFNGLLFYRDGAQPFYHPTDDWVTLLHTSHLERDGVQLPKESLIIGLANNSIEVLSV